MCFYSPEETFSVKAEYICVDFATEDSIYEAIKNKIADKEIGILGNMMLHSFYSFFFFKSLLYLIVFLIGSRVPRARPLVLIGLLYLIILLFMPLLFSEQCWCHVWLPSDVSGCTRKGKSYSSYGQWTVHSLNDQDLYFFVVVMIGLLKKFIKHTVDVFLSSFLKKILFLTYERMFFCHPESKGNHLYSVYSITYHYSSGCHIILQLHVT